MSTILLRTLGSIALTLSVMSRINKQNEETTGIEVTNGIAGTVTKDGKSVQGASVTLFSSDHNPQAGLDSIIETTTDENGKYELKIEESGLYNIEYRMENDNFANLKMEQEINTDEKLTLDAELNATSTLSISLKESSLSSGDYFYIPGTSISAVLGEDDITTGFILLDDIPAIENTTIRIVEGNIDVIFQDSIIISPADTLNLFAGDTTIVPPDTSAENSTDPNFFTYKLVNIDLWFDGGYSIGTDLYNFPLLVRLDSTNFNFDDIDHKEIRFSKQSGDFLTHEIEHWDENKNAAAVWVKMDTIFVNGNEPIKLMVTQDSIVNYSNPAGVFDTTLGFQGVWHLGDIIFTDPFGIEDATINQNHGLGYGFSNPIRLPGVVGLAQPFNGTSEYFMVEGNNSLDILDGDFTYSLWVNPTKLDNPDNYQIFTRRGGSTNIIELEIYSSGTASYRVYDFSNANHGTSTDALQINEWYHISLVRRSSSVFIYVNGVESVESVPNNDTINTKQPMYIGSEEGGNSSFFEGRMDEFRFSNTARSHDWIVMSYENQKIGSNVVRVE